MDKFCFYRELAETAWNAIDKDPAIDAGKLCRMVILKAKEIYNEME